MQTLEGRGRMVEWFCERRKRQPFRGEILKKITIKELSRLVFFVTFRLTLKHYSIQMDNFIKDKLSSTE